jgi:hypothetical protein
MNGDKSANSFLLAAVDENSEDYNYFVLPNDSLSGFISPSVDTLHLCFGELIGWASQTIDISGPAYNYLWNTGDTTSSIYVNLTGEYSIYVLMSVIQIEIRYLFKWKKFRPYHT